MAGGGALTGGDMISEADARLRSWAREVLGEVQVSTSPPGEEDQGKGVSLYLLSLDKDAPAQTAHGRRLGLDLRYLATAWAPSETEAHELLGELASAALRSGVQEVTFDPLSPEAWRAFGVPPMPSFRLRVPITVEIEERPVKRVLEPLVLKQSPLTTLRGRVVSASDRAVPDVAVEIPNLDLRTRTDGDGRFRFQAVPSEPPVTTLRVHGKGVGGMVRLEEAPPEPLIIRLSELEG